MGKGAQNQPVSTVVRSLKAEHHARAFKLKAILEVCFQEDPKGRGGLCDWGEREGMSQWTDEERDEYNRRRLEGGALAGPGMSNTGLLSSNFVR